MSSAQHDLKHDGRLDVVFQVNTAPTDLPHLRHILAHQIRLWRDQVRRIVVTVDTMPGHGRYAEAWYELQAPFRTFLETVAADAGCDFRIVDVDYAESCIEAVSQTFLGGGPVPLKDSYGAPFYAYLFGLLAADARYVLHSDADMLYGGRSEAWLREAVTLLQRQPDVLLTGPYPGPPTRDGRIPPDIAAQHATAQRYGSFPELLHVPGYALRFSHMSTRSFLIDLDRFRSSVGALRPESTPPPRWSKRSPGAAPLEISMSGALREHGLTRIDLLGTQPGMWVVHPPYRGQAFLRELPSLIAQIERGDVPDAQRGDCDLNDSMVDWSDERRRERRRRRRGRLVRLAITAGSWPRALIDRLTAPSSMLRRLAHSPLLAPVHRLYRRRKVRLLVDRHPARVVSHNYGGNELSVLLEDPLSESWYDHDWPALPELDQLASSRLTSGARVFDLGAHHGVVAMMLARKVGSEGSVVAVEADRHNYHVAGRNLVLNRCANVRLLHAAVSAHEGSLRFAAGLNGQVLSRGIIATSRVPAVTVDGLAERYGHPDVVFLDVEGYELEALRGAAQCLADNATDFFVEVHIGEGLEEAGGSVAEILGLFPEARFRRLVSPAGDQLDSYAFTELDVGTVPEARFYLIATARGDRR